MTYAVKSLTPLLAAKHRRNVVAFFLPKINRQKKQQHSEEPPFAALVIGLVLTG
jgi:hypothetical protein